MIGLKNKSNGYKSRYKLGKSANIPIELYKSMRGEYFIGYADNLRFGKELPAWAKLCNPYGSEISLYVNAWTVSRAENINITAELWLNTVPPGIPIISRSVTPANTSLIPAPLPKVVLQFSSFAEGKPENGIKISEYRGVSGRISENGKLIFPPGGSFCIILRLQDTDKTATAGICFEWWEEKSGKKVK